MKSLINSQCTIHNS